MHKVNCPCIKQEICNGVYWVTNDCSKGTKEGFRPRVAFAHTCSGCQINRENLDLQGLKQAHANT